MQLSQIVIVYKYIDHDIIRKLSHSKFDFPPLLSYFYIKESNQRINDTTYTK